MDKMNDNNLGDYILENSPLFEAILKDFNNINLDIYNYLETIKSKGSSKLVPEKENIKEGTKWLYVLFDFYIKHEGVRNVSCIQFFNYIKDIWDIVADSNEILYILEDMFGGISIDNISSNFKDWLNKNMDVVKPEYRDIINIYSLSTESIKTSLNKDIKDTYFIIDL
jgi:hypothetical protein